MPLSVLRRADCALVIQDFKGTSRTADDDIGRNTFGPEGMKMRADGPSGREVPEAPRGASATDRSASLPPRRQRVFIAWGLVSALLILAGIGFLVYSTRPQTAASSAPQNELPTPTPTSAVESPMPEVDGGVDSPPGFTASALDNGWSRYVSGAEGFSIELPPGWLTGTRDDLGPELKFSATDTDPTYGPVSGGGSPGVFVMKHPVHEGEVPRLYYEVNRLQLQEDPRVIGEVELTDTNLGDGRIYVMRATYRSPFGRRSETMYGLLLGSFEFRLHFAVPARYLNEYEGLFHDIASTFHVSTP